MSHATRETWLRRGLYGFSVAVLLFLWVPLLVMILLSFAQNASTVFPFQGFTLEHYAATLQDASLRNSVMNSLKIATVSASIATILGVLAAFGLARYRFKFKQAFRTFGILPMVIPGVVLGMALLIFFRTIVPGLSPGPLAIILTHSVYGFPFVLLPVAARLYSFDESLEEAGRDLGAGPLGTFADITLPIIAPAVAAGFLFAWVRSFEDFIRVFFVRGLTDVLTTTMFSMIKYGAAPKMNAISALIVFGIAVALAVAMNLGNVADFVAGGGDEGE